MVFEEGIMEQVIVPVLPTCTADKRLKVFVNSPGRFVIGGPWAMPA